MSTVKPYEIIHGDALSVLRGMESESDLQEYQAYLERKIPRFTASGFSVSDKQLNRHLFDFQRYIVRRSLENGRFAIFADCGLGKTLMQLEWANQIWETTGKPVLIIAPLAVPGQTINEGIKFSIPVDRYISDSNKPIAITNYEQIEKINVSAFGGVVLDESSILKNFDGKTKQLLIDRFAETPYKLCCTATPSPNDVMELGNHAEFLNVMSRNEMLSMYFVHDGGDTGQWRLKGHAETDFWAWVASWSVMLARPQDLGFEAKGYDLPELKFIERQIVTAIRPGGFFNTVAVSATTFNQELRLTKIERLDQAAKIVNDSSENFIIWVKQNEEADYLKSLIPGAVEVRGNEKPEVKEQKLLGFQNNEFRVLITKTKIGRFGLNYQNCHNQIFASLDFSFEALYQSIRRSYRFGQEHPVNIYLITTDTMQNVIGSIERKEKQFQEMQTRMIEASSCFQPVKHGYLGKNERYDHSDCTLIKGDCVQLIRDVPAESIGFSIFSPPFASLYTYSDSLEDMGNCSSYEEFTYAFSLLVEQLYRVLWSGRNVAVHCMDLPIQKNKEGYIGLRDFSGLIRECFEKVGFIYHSRVTIWKNPVTEMQRTKALGLLHKQVKKDAAMSRVGIPDYLLIFRKPGEHENPVRCDIPVDLWQKYASPVWMDIDYSKTLNGRAGRHENDERHICLSSGSLVLTREHGYLEIEEVEPGDNVLTHTGRWMPVLAKQCNGIAETVRICGQGVADLTVTPDHELWARMARESRPKDYARNHEPEWAYAKDTLGSYINLKLPPEEPNDLTTEEWWIVGRWLGDGHRGTRRTSGARGRGFGEFIISCSHEESPGLFDRLGDNAGHSHQITATQITLKGLRNEVREVLNRCGEGAANKRLPGEAVTLSQEKSEALLAGYLSADGHFVEKHDRYCSSSVSRALLLGLAIVAQRARGVVASVYAGRSERDGEIQGRRVSMKQDWIFAFRATEGYRKSGWIDEQGAWKKVRKIECAGEREVWDLKVAEDASFTAEGAIVHNCPLQLETIERSIHLWTNEGDMVLTPFAGIGSEVYQALKMNRKAIGFELKDSYFDIAVQNAKAVIENDRTQNFLFTLAE